VCSRSVSEISAGLEPVGAGSVRSVLNLQGCSEYDHMDDRSITIFVRWPVRVTCVTNQNYTAVFSPMLSLEACYLSSVNCSLRAVV
jgi:hypothetical protein